MRCIFKGGDAAWGGGGGGRGGGGRGEVVDILEIVMFIFKAT
jgi:hypothetical protein